MTTEKAPNSHLDQFDHQILSLLAKDGRMPVSELANQLGLSKTPCSVRLKRLISEGYIVGFKAVLNPKKLNNDHVAFVEVKLHDTKEAALIAFNEAVSELAEVEQCHMIAGPFDYLLKVRTQNIAAYRQVLGEKISSLPFVASSSTYVAMDTIKEVVT